MLDPVAWYGINYAGTQITQWDFQNKGTLTSPARLSFVLKVPLRYLSQHNLFRNMWPDPAKGLLYSIICWVSTKNVIPRMSKGSLNTHAKFFSGSNMSFENLLAPSLSLSIFTFKPEHSSKSSKVSRHWESEVWVPSKRKKKLSSAYCPSKNSSALLTVMPLILPFCFISSARSSTQIMKSYGDKRSPCLTPLETEKEKVEQWPLYGMELLIFL